jgi:hypothetical protein
LTVIVPATILGLWIYFLHPPPDNFAATMTDEERAAFTRTPVARAAAGRQDADPGRPDLGPVNTGADLDC